MLKASEFIPIAFEAAVVAFDLTKFTGRLAARLLKKYGDLIDDEVGLGVPDRSYFTKGSSQLLFRDYGLLSIQPHWASFWGGFPEEVGPWQDWVHGRLRWAVELLALILRIQKQRAVALNLEVTWMIRGESTTTRLVEYLGLSKSMNGFFAASENFEIRGDTTVELPGLFFVDCEFTGGRLGNYADPENVGVQIKYRTPDNRFGEKQVDYSRDVLDQFFATAPQVMREQLEKYFPERGAV